MQKNTTKQTYQYCSVCGQELTKRSDGRLHCAACGYVLYLNPRPTVTALLRHDDTLLLTKRAHEPFQDWWDLPGGFIEIGESAEEALQRELKEETGLVVSIEQFVGTYTDIYPMPWEQVPILNLLYIATTDHADVSVADDVIGAQWFDVNHIPIEKVAFESCRAALRDYLQTLK